MKNKVTLKSIAAHFDLSVSTVSRILNQKAEQFRISKETVELVTKYANECGYSPNLIAKGLQASKTFTIGLMLPDIADPFFANMAKQIGIAALHSEYSILLVDNQYSIENEIRQMRNLLGRKVDGFIVAPAGNSFEHFTEAFKENVPLIFVDRYSKTGTIPYITSDNFQGAYNATKLLIDHGHKRIALIKGDEFIEPVKERYRGYLQAMHDAGIEVDKQLVVGNEFSIENGYDSVMLLLTNNIKQPTAILSMSSQIGLGVFKAIDEKGLSIPNDISLIIFDEQPYFAFLKTPITTIQQDSQSIGEKAIGYLLNKIDNPKFEFSSQTIPVKLFERSSIKLLDYEMIESPFGQ